MKLRHQKMFKKSLNTIFQNIAKSYEKNDFDLQVVNLSDLVNYFRPEKPLHKKISIQPLLDYLQADPSRLALFANFITSLLSKKNFKYLLADAGILQTIHLRQEIKARIFSSIIPNQPNKDSIEYILNQVFYKHTDIQWIQKIPKTELLKLVELIGGESMYNSFDKKTPISEVFKAIRFTMQRMSGRALETDVIKMLPEYEDFDNPFIALERSFEEIENQLISHKKNYIPQENSEGKHIYILLNQCYEYVDKAFKNRSKYGITMNVNQSLLRIKQQLDRLKDMLPFLFYNETEEVHHEKTLELSLLLIRINCLKNNVRKMFNEGFQLIALEITQHTAKTGEHYITKGAKEYKKMFISASLGGVIVGIMCILKLALGKIHVSDFGHAAIYSLNYALGFTAIYLLGGTLATKQPAMTASALIQSFERGKNENNIYLRYKAFAELFSRLFRSQFIAFIGNVFLAFPIALLLVYLIQLSFGVNIASEKALKLLTDNSPIHSPSIFHASIAGVFLFLSGIISGNVSNSIKHNRLAYRISEHPVLKKSVGTKKANSISKWIEKNWSGVISNCWFGVFMGSTASIGIFLGLDLDIRHITFASGNLALGLFGENFSISNELLFWSIIGIGTIGFMNFIVSFTLSLALAMRSRNIPIFEIRFLFFVVIAQFRVDPLAFFIPRSNSEKTEELTEH